MDAHTSATTREDYSRLQEALEELSTTQAQHAERIMRLEKRNEDGSKARNVWGPSSPFPSGLTSSQHDTPLNPAAEAFRNFDAEPHNTMISSLTLDGDEHARRAAASRANSVRFDESANNHYGPSRASMDLPTRTGSGLGSHPLSERSLSHRSERGSTSGFPRTNSFGLESSRLLGSIHNSPRVAANPPPGFFVLGPCPSIIRCWLTETFSNDSLLYAAVCTGSSTSSIGLSLLQKLGLLDSVIEENGLRKVKLLVYLTEAKIYLPSSRSPSPAPHVPTITAKFLIHDRQLAHDKSIQIVLGSDVLRQHGADILFSQDKLILFGDDRNQLSVPLVRPEDDSAYKNLTTRPRSRRTSIASDAPPSDLVSEHSAPGIIGRPARPNSLQGPTSPIVEPSVTSTATSRRESTESRRLEQPELSLVTSSESNQVQLGDENRSATSNEKTPGLTPKTFGVWSNSWRTNTGGANPETTGSMRNTSSGTFTRSNAPRTMKVLRPAGRTMASVGRTTSASSPMLNDLDAPFENQSGISTPDTKTSQSSGNEAKTPVTKSNPVGSASAFGWLTSSQQRSSTAGNGSK